jgi:hypothetical protein
MEIPNIVLKVPFFTAPKSYECILIEICIFPNMKNLNPNFFAINAQKDKNQGSHKDLH